MARPVSSMTACPAKVGATWPARQSDCQAASAAARTISAPPTCAVRTSSAPAPAPRPIPLAKATSVSITTAVVCRNRSPRRIAAPGWLQEPQRQGRCTTIHPGHGRQSATTPLAVSDAIASTRLTTVPPPNIASARAHGSLRSIRAAASRCSSADEKPPSSASASGQPVATRPPARALATAPPSRQSGPAPCVPARRARCARPAADAPAAPPTPASGRTAAPRTTSPTVTPQLKAALVVPEASTSTQRGAGCRATSITAASRVAQQRDHRCHQVRSARSSTAGAGPAHRNGGTATTTRPR